MDMCPVPKLHALVNMFHGYVPCSKVTVLSVPVSWIIIGQYMSVMSRSIRDTQQPPPVLKCTDIFILYVAMNKVQHNNYAMYPVPRKFQITFSTSMTYEIVVIH